MAQAVVVIAYFYSDDLLRRYIPHLIPLGAKQVGR